MRNEATKKNRVENKVFTNQKRARDEKEERKDPKINGLSLICRLFMR